MKDIRFTFINEEVYKKGIEALINAFKDDEYNTLEETDKEYIITLNKV